MSKASRAAKRAERFGPKSDVEFLREITQANSRDAALKVLREYGHVQWKEGYEDGLIDGSY